jgi:hypothetical protein
MKRPLFWAAFPISLSGPLREMEHMEFDNEIDASFPMFMNVEKTVERRIERGTYIPYPLCQ